MKVYKKNAIDMRYLPVIIFAFSITCYTASAQDNQFPTVGDPCPPFVLNNVLGYNNQELKNTDFIGKKWLIIEMWAKTCRSCLESLPKINELQATFKDDVQFVLVGDNSQKYNKGIEELYDRVKKKQHLSLTAAFDSTLKTQFYFRVIPHLVIVDRGGIIYAVIGSKDLTEEKLRELVEGKNPRFNLKIE